MIWLAGIWLPIHGYNFEDTPLWAGISMLPLSAGFLVAGPVSGFLSDKFGPRVFATGGLLVSAAAFVGLILIPVDFQYYAFALIVLVAGMGAGFFASPNTSAIMSSVPANQRGAAAGMMATMMNSGTALSIGIFFSLLIAGLSKTLPETLYNGLIAEDVPVDVATKLSKLPPVSTLFAALLGYNPMEELLLPTGLLSGSTLTSSDVDTLVGHYFFPTLVAGPFHSGLVIVFIASAVLLVVGAAISVIRPKQYFHQGDQPAESTTKP